MVVRKDVTVLMFQTEPRGSKSQRPSREKPPTGTLTSNNELVTVAGRNSHDLIYLQQPSEMGPVVNDIKQKRKWET